MSIDPIANMLSAMKNAAAAGREEVVVPYSGLKEQLAKLLKKEGFALEVRKFKEKGSKRFSLAIKLARDDAGRLMIRHAKRISRPGQRIYSTSREIKAPPLGVKVISTSKGLLTHKEARKKRLGGEVVAEVC
jgi:small subunit ribosomal protein S8